jgi:FixJ family two-component response regulator
MMGEKPVVYIVDDDKAVRESIAALVQANGIAVRCHGSAEEFLETFDCSRLGCLVADVRMSGMSGIELQETLQARGVSLPVIIITGYPDISTAVQAIRTGAVTFLEKPCREKELLANIDNALDWHRKKRAEEARAAELEGRLARLTRDEYRVMQEMVAGKPNKTIAAELEIGLRTVELRRAKVFKKMEAHSMAELVRLSVTAKRGTDATPHGVRGGL